MLTFIWPAQNVTVDTTGLATSAKQDTGNTSLASIDTKLSSQATAAKQDTGNTSLSSIDSKFTTLNAKDFATSAKQDTGNTSLSSIDTKFTTLNAKDFATQTTLVANGVLLGAVTETAPASDTASSGLNGRLQRIAQRLTSLIALLPTSLGQKTMANGLAVTIASDQTAVPASQSGTWNITNVSGAVSLPTGASTESTLSTLNGKVSANYGAATGAIRTAAQLGNASGVADFGSGSSSAQTLRNVPAVASAATLSNVAASATSVTLLASNANRRGATFYNDSASANLLIKFGATASASSFTVLVLPGGYYEMPTPVYTGIIDGIWGAAVGNARITELT